MDNFQTTGTFHFEGISGLDFSYYENLPKAKGMKVIESELIHWNGKDKDPIQVPTIISICPACKGQVKWHTFGALPWSLKCECGQEFQYKTE